MQTSRFHAYQLILVVIIPLLCRACKGDETLNNTPVELTDLNENGIPDAYEKIYGATNIYTDDDYIYIETLGLPDHTSPYYIDTEWEDSLYEAYSGSNADFFQPSQVIAETHYTFKIPIHPAEAESKTSTSGGPIGVSLNGVPFFNQYNGMGAPLGAEELNTFDQWNGHPTPMNTYHYHAEPIYLTLNAGDDKLLGFLLDGFPVYGSVENGIEISNDDLDAYHGHFSVTEDFPDGIYHYHITLEAPYINGDGYFGTPGTVSF